MDKFINFCKREVVRRDPAVTNVDEVFVVWSCKTLQNKKAMLSAKPKGAMYFEFTYNGDKQECYIDGYSKDVKAVARLEL